MNSMLLKLWLRLPVGWRIRVRNAGIAVLLLLQLLLYAVLIRQVVTRFSLRWAHAETAAAVPTVTVLVSSRAGEAKVRAVIRETWLSKSFTDSDAVAPYADVQYKFFVLESAAVDKDEIKWYGDVVVLPRPEDGHLAEEDEAYLATYKLGRMLQWAQEHAAHSDFLVKTETDAMLHMGRLSRTILQRYTVAVRAGKQHLYFGHLIRQWAPMRTGHARKGVASATECIAQEDMPYMEPVRPPYMLGACIGLSRQLASRLARMFQEEPCALTPGRALDDITVGLMVQALERSDRWNIVYGDAHDMQLEFFNLKWRAVPYMHPFASGLHQVVPEQIPVIYKHSFLFDEPFVRCPGDFYPGLERLPYKPKRLLLAPMPTKGAVATNVTLIEPNTALWTRVCWNHAAQSVAPSTVKDVRCCPAQCYERTRNKHGTNKTVNKWILKHFADVIQL